MEQALLAPGSFLLCCVSLCPIALTKCLRLDNSPIRGLVCTQLGGLKITKVHFYCHVATNLICELVLKRRLCLQHAP